MAGAAQPFSAVIQGGANMSGRGEREGAARAVSGALTVDQLARRVGMSARNIRAYQARRLLAPPARSGRNAYYDEGHVRRLEEIQTLQRQGYNLAAIAAILGVRERPADSEELAATLDRLLAQQPLLIHTLSRHGVVARGDDGRIRTVRPVALRAALDLSQAGIQPSPSLQLLSEALDRVVLVADDLVRTVVARALIAAPRSADLADGPGPPPAPPAALTEGLVSLLTEAFRVVVENRGQAWLPELAAAGPRADGELTPRAAGSVDFG
jgi:DNA-binding transcriptional MerR regulator